MGKARSLITSALVVSGATALSTVDVGATELDSTLFWDTDLSMMEMEMIEKALSNYTNPLNRIAAEMSQDPAETFTYTVKEGDTLSEIAQRFQIPLQEIVQQNDIKNEHRLGINQELEIRIAKKTYVIKLGDNAEQIAQEHEITVEELLASNAVIQYSAGYFYPGLEIQIPTMAPELPKEEPLEYHRQKANTVVVASRSEGTIQPGGFIWPVSGTLTSRYGMRWGKQHNGIDIANQLNKEAKISAAKSGVVKDTGFHQGGYGNLVILDHGGGMETYYAHLSKISVEEGQEVKQGETIGYMGKTGRTTGYHLHFEIRKNDKPVNPLKYLD